MKTTYKWGKAVASFGLSLFAVTVVIWFVGLILGVLVPNTIFIYDNPDRVMINGQPIEFGPSNVVRLSTWSFRQEIELIYPDKRICGILQSNFLDDERAFWVGRNIFEGPKTKVTIQ